MSDARTALTIREVESFDLPVLAALHAACFTAPWDQHWTQQSFADVLGMPGAGACIAAIDSEPVGFAVARIAADEAELLLIGTRPEFRKAGHGRAMMDHILDALRRRGARAVFLEVAEPNVAALNFYQEHGFQTVGRRPDYFRGNSTVDALVLTRPLDGVRSKVVSDKSSQ